MLSTALSYSPDFSLLSVNIVISPGFMYFLNSILTFGSSTSNISPLNDLVSSFFMLNSGYLLSRFLSLHGLTKPVHWTVGSKTIVGIPFLRASSTKMDADTDLPVPVAPAVRAWVVRSLGLYHALMSVSAIFPSQNDLSVFFGSFL